MLFSFHSLRCRFAYSWNQSTGALIGTPIVDTNGEIGASHPIGSFVFTIAGDRATIRDNDDETTIFRVTDSPSSVAHWRFIKGIGHSQSIDDTEPSASDWSVFAIVQTENAGDATSITVSGGGISGNRAFEQNGNLWEFEVEHTSEAALDAEFPSGATYTITLSGGTLGTLIQQFTLGAKAYPNTPYLTGSTFTVIKSINAYNNFTATFSNPGSLTATNGSTTFEIFAEPDENSVFREQSAGAATSALIPVGTLDTDTTFFGFLEYSNAQMASGTGGFEIDGTTSHNTSIDFSVITVSQGGPMNESPIVGGWQFGDGAVDNSGVLVFLPNGIYFHAEDTVADANEFDGMERGTYIWNESTGALTITPIVDTNGEIGASHPNGSFVLTIAGDGMNIRDNVDVTALRRVTYITGASAIDGTNGQITIEFKGIIQDSNDLSGWKDVSPQPTSPWTFTPVTTKRFFLSRGK